MRTTPTTRAGTTRTAWTARTAGRTTPARWRAATWLLLLAALPGIVVEAPATAGARLPPLRGTEGGPPLVVSRPWPPGWYGDRRAVAVGADGAALRLVWADDFDRLSYRWTRYRGRPGGDPAGWWEPSHVAVSGGSLVLTGSVGPGVGGDPTKRWVSGGVKLEHDLPPLVYGRADVRLRAEPGPWAVAVLLWPADNRWPPEIDFLEDNGGDRRLVTATLHSGRGAARRAVWATLRADFSQWHTWSVTWSPGQVVYELDGVPWARTSDPGVPSGGMRLVVQQQAWPCGHGWYVVCPGPTTPPNHVYVDRVAVWTR